MICALNVFSPNLGHWMKHRNITWLSKFLLTKFDEDKWVESFHMNKNIVFNITNASNLAYKNKIQSTINDQYLFKFEYIM